LLNDWENVVLNCDQCLSLDTKNYKALNLKGVALIEIGKNAPTSDNIKEGIVLLTKSVEMYNASEQPDNQITKELTDKLKKGKKILWLKEKEREFNENSETKMLIKKLIKNDKSQNKNDQDKMLNEILDMIKLNEKSFQDLEVPEYMCCKITFELMKEPIITPDGICYEKEILTEHLNKNGYFDPVTRKPLPVSKPIPNKTLRSAIEHFELENPWVHEYMGTIEDYRKIAF